MFPESICNIKFLCDSLNVSMCQKVVILIIVSLSEHFHFGTVFWPRVSWTYLWQVTASWILGRTVSLHKEQQCAAETFEIVLTVSVHLFSLTQKSKVVWRLTQCGVEGDVFLSALEQEAVMALLSLLQGSCHGQTSRCLLLNLQLSLRNLSRAAGTCPAFLKPTHGNMIPFIVISYVKAWY